MTCRLARLPPTAVLLFLMIRPQPRLLSAPGAPPTFPPTTPDAGPCMGHAPDSRDLGGGSAQPPCCECVLMALGEEAGDAGAIYEGQGMELLLHGQTLAGTPRRLCGHCDTLDHWLPPMVITPLVLTVSYGNSRSLLIQGIWGQAVEQATSQGLGKTRHHEHS